MSGKTDKNSKNLDIKTDAGKGVQGSRRRALKVLLTGGGSGLLPCCRSAGSNRWLSRLWCPPMRSYQVRSYQAVVRITP